MAISPFGYFWNSNVTTNELGEQIYDREYDADSFEWFLKKFYTSGVFNGDLQVTANGDMTVTLSPGYVNVDGKVMYFESPQIFTAATADATYDRIDTVVVERNDIERRIYAKMITGAHSVNPAPAAPVRADGVHQMVVANVRVVHGAVRIIGADITDMRMDDDVCGLVAGTVDKLNFAAFKAQFDSWFDDLKTALDGDIAANLVNRINQLQTQWDTHRLEATVSLSGEWFGSTAPYTQSISVPGILATDNPHVTPVYSDELTTSLLEQETWEAICGGNTVDGGIIFKCLEDKPVTPLTVQIEVNR